MTPPTIWVVNGVTEYEVEVHLDFDYPEISASDTSGETVGITRLSNVDTGEACRVFWAGS